MVIHFARDAHACVRACGEPFDRSFGSDACFLVQRAHSPFDQAAVRDDVVGGASLDRADGYHGWVHRLHLTRDHSLQLRDQHRGGDQRIDSSVRIGGVTRLAAHDDVEAVGRGKTGPMHIAELTDRHFRMIVEGKCEIDLGIFHQPVVDHGAHSADTFFRRLKHQLDGAGELRGKVLQHRSDAEQRSRVDIVATGVHQARDRAGEWQAGGFLDRQRVHVGPDG